MAEPNIEPWLSGVVAQLARYPKEDAAIGALEILLFTGNLAPFMGWPAVTQYEREVRIGNGRCDFLLHHADRSVTLLEAKANGDRRAVVGGIGQLFLYEASLPRYVTGVRKALAVPGYGELDIAKACELAGVDYVPLGDVGARFAKYNAILANLRQSSHA